MKAFKEVGLKKSFRFLIFTLAYVLYRGLIFPQFRGPFLRILGAKIGKNCIVHSVRFFNYYRTGFSGLTLGDDCFIGDECLLDLASPITLGNQVTLAERVTILTHMNVGYEDHPLQKSFPPSSKAVVIRRGSFLGAGATVLNGVEVGEESFVAACALVRDNVPPFTLVGGVPAKTVRSLK